MNVVVVWLQNETHIYMYFVLCIQDSLSLNLGAPLRCTILNNIVPLYLLLFSSSKYEKALTSVTLLVLH